MKGPILLGFSNHKEVKQAQQCKASDCYLVDNIEYQKLFNPLCAPEGIPTELESMYEDLGSIWLTSRVKENTREVNYC